MPEFSQRLKALIGHDVMVHMLHDPHDLEGLPNGIPPGRLREVKDNYLMIETKAEVEGGFAGEGGEWFAALQYVTSIVHMVPECTGCLIETT